MAAGFLFGSVSWPRFNDMISPVNGISRAGKRKKIPEPFRRMGLNLPTHV
ncbi:Uncharacterised protein [Bordetella pertussis]|nr:Uncharacterised protein [Bordetella pertussis]